MKFPFVGTANNFSTNNKELLLMTWEAFTLNATFSYSNTIQSSGCYNLTIFMEISQTGLQNPDVIVNIFIYRTGSISFVFAYVFAEKCTHRRLAPPNGSAPPPQREILDLPLLLM